MMNTSFLDQLLAQQLQGPKNPDPFTKRNQAQQTLGTLSAMQSNPADISHMVNQLIQTLIKRRAGQRGQPRIQPVTIPSQPLPKVAPYDPTRDPRLQGYKGTAQGPLGALGAFLSMGGGDQALPPMEYGA